ncbi:MAG: response regulator [Candidatus Latescibacteria bacterium]|nr:response regulator [Candidatus Latescibacterota bacterium]
MPLNVLIVDDSDVMRKVVKRVLGLSGFEIGSVLEAANGDEALMVLVDTPIDLVLSDVNMPVMDGVELLKAMKAERRFADIPVIIISTEGRSERINEILGYGADGYITKPFKPEDIRRVIQDALGVEADGTFVEEPEDSDF